MSDPVFRPDLLPTIRKLEIHAKRDVLSRSLAGSWISKIRGRGIEFAGYRQYTPGDDAGQIDWRASVRSRKLLVKELEEEKSLNIMLAIDASDSMLFGTTDKLKAEYVAELTSSLTFATLRGGESVGLALWADKVKRFVPLSQGIAQHAVLMRALADVHSYGGPKNFTHVMMQLLAYMQQRALVIIISDFVGYDSSWDTPLKVLAQKHELICILVRDRRDRELPSSGEYVLSDPSSGQRLVIDAADYAAPYSAYVKQEESHLADMLRRAGSELLSLETTDNYSSALVKFMSIHNKRVE